MNTRFILIGSGFWPAYWARHAEAFAAGAFRAAIIIAAYVVLRFALLKSLNRLTNSLLRKVGEDITEARQARLRALRTALGSLVTFVLGLVAAIMLLHTVGLNIVPLITTASVAGLAVGFGAQKLVRDFIAGLFILIEDQYGVGDYVTIGAVSGLVEELGMRTTRVRDKSGRLWTIANGDVVQVCNHSRGGFRMAHDVAVPASVNLEEACELLEEVGSKLAEDLPQMVRSPFVCEGLAALTGSTATIRLKAEVSPWYQDEVKEELNKRIRAAFVSKEMPLA